MPAPNRPAQAPTRAEQGVSEPTRVERLYLLPLGHLDTSYEQMLPGTHDAARYRFPVTAALLDLGDRGWMLIDTGMDDDLSRAPSLVWGATPLADDIRPDLPHSETLTARLDELGVSPQDITHIVNTHLHFDHAGNNHRFPHATVHVRSQQIQDTADRPGSYPIRWNPNAPSTHPIDTDQQIVPGVHVIATPGHVLGHQSVRIELTDSPDMLLCGDAIPGQDFLDTGNFDSFRDPATAAITAHHLLGQAQTRHAVAVYSHDQAQLDRLRTTPDFYA
ncbi:hypothetical protein BN12_4030029 [Nostocoides japonicum T1-X7]|uniref:Metallo-beta-lactamase domain-containing protein n=1 Tax=Nostocoides japonicum T1-X7 TaxID=1194083 RepID=A0A077M4X6_9MICO|nr:N-acyl homoserine lactonase family protein [Tetrasphaera japonica]CCH79154.1 hypothetical protein BN12_4030029 [Tetrasphaera japonica T1-X7]